MGLRGPSYDDANKRIRAGLVVLIVGIALLLAGLGMALLRGPAHPADPIARRDQPQVPPEDAALAARVTGILAVVGGVLVVTLLVAGYTLFRVTRRFAVPQRRRGFGPTAANDVWRMHKAPEAPPPDAGEEP